MLVKASISLRTAFADFQNTCEALPQFLSEDGADHLWRLGQDALQLYHAASSEACAQLVFSWLMLPKAHVMDHLLATVKSERYNFRFFHNFEGENMIGVLKPLCVKSLGKGMEARFLKRSLLKLVSLKEREIRRMR